MNKVTAKDFRTTKEVKLPSGLTVTCYSSLLIGELSGVSLKDDNFDSNLEVIVKVIKEWNFYEEEGDDKPLPINVANFKKLPASDFQAIVDEIKLFSNQQKKT